MKAKRILATLALAATVLTTSCAEPPTMVDFMPSDADSYNYNGTPIVWAWAKGASSQGYYEIDTPQYDILMERIADVETELNVDIEAILDTGKVNKETIHVKLLSGIPSYDIITSDGVSEFAESGVIYSLTDLSEYIDLTDTVKFGSLTAQEGYMYQGEVYGVTPAQWPGFEPMGGYVIAYNRDMFQENGLTDLHEYYENEIWTYDTFADEFMAKTNLQDSDGNPVKLFLTHASNLYQALVHSNQVKFVKRNDDGTLVADPYSRSFTNAMKWGEYLVDTYYDKINFEDTFDIRSYRMGINPTTIAYTAAFTTGNIAYNEYDTFESGVMPFPCGPDATYGEWTTCMVHIYGFMIPITSINAEASAKTIDLLAEPFEEFGGEAGLFEYYKYNIFMDELDAEIFSEVAKNTSYTYADVSGGFGAEIRGNFQDYLKSPSKSMTEAYDKYRDMLTELIEDWMIPNYEAVYGDE